jgi:asparagine synthetase B (glutamine-hydrolysing)
MTFLEGDESLRFGMPIGPAPRRESSTRITRHHSSAAESLLATVASVATQEHCFVEFSGGCDSSLVLSTATQVRRRSGLPDPVPISFRFDGIESEERSFQEAMISWLGLTSWRVHDFGADADFLGPVSLASLRRVGLFWPATLHFKADLYSSLPPGSVVLNGEGGDEVFGKRRLSPILFVAQRARYRIRPSRRALSAAAAALQPRPVRFRRTVNEINNNYWPDWLAERYRSAFVGDIARWESAEPLRPSRWPDFYRALPRTRILLHNYAEFGRRYGVNIASPLLDAAFMADVARFVSWRSYGDRTAILKRHFGDLLPEIIADRRTKAEFGSSYFGPYTRAFAERWDGSGLPEGVDGTWLKNLWTTGDVCHGGTSMLLHAAWLATEGASEASGAQV